jgi:hypothetical protein
MKDFGLTVAPSASELGSTVAAVLGKLPGPRTVA